MTISNFMQNLLALLPLIIVALMLLVVSSYVLIKYWLLYLRIASAPLTKTAEAKSGIISVEGKAQLYNNETVIAPSQKPCVWYHYTVRTNPMKPAYKRNLSNVRFIISDNAGSIIINPPEKLHWWDDLYLIQTINFTSWMADSATDPQPKKNMAFSSKSYQWNEWRIENNQDIYIYGIFKAAPQATSIFGEVGEPINIAAPLIITNLTRVELLRYLVRKLYLVGCCFAASSMLAGFVVYSLIVNG